jgi:hypothetical protein
MLFLVGAWLVLAAVCIPVGIAILRWTGASVFDRAGDRLVLSTWLGLLTLGSVLLAVALLFALSPLVGAVVGGGMAAAALASSAVRDELLSLLALLRPRLLLGLLALAVGVAVATTQPVIWFDTGLYHESAIRWLSEHGVVEGIGLVHHRLGFGSTWFALDAPFGADGLRGHAAVVLNGFALLLLSLHAVLCLSRALRRVARPNDWLVIAGAALLIPVLAASQKVHVSASPDLPVNVLALLVGWAILTLAGGPQATRPPEQRFSPGPSALPLLLALGATAIKPTAAPLLVVAALYYVLSGAGKLRRAGWVGALGVALLAPWVAYEFVTTGCPAFPAPVCADVSWSVGTGVAEEAAEAVEGSRERAPSPAEAPREGLGWIGPWLTDDLSPWLASVGLASFVLAGGGLAMRLRAPPGSSLRRLAPWLALAGIAGLFLFLLRAEEIFMVALAVISLIPLWPRAGAAGWLLALGLAGIALTIYAAPDPRFAFGYMAVLLGRLVVYFPRPLWARIRPYVTPSWRVPQPGLATLLALAAVAAALLPVARPTTTRADVVERFGLLLPPATKPSPITIEEVNGIPYRIPADGLCWATELPCTPGDELDPTVALDEPGEGIGGGFVRSP